MNRVKLFLAVVLTTLMSVSFVSCSDDDTPKLGVDVTPGDVTKTSLSFTVTPKNALQCAYVCVKEGEAIPTPDAILADPANAIPADEPTLVNVDGLETEVDYVVVAVVSDGTTLTSKQTTIKTAEKEHITLEDARVTLSGGWSGTREADLEFVSGETYIGLAALYDSKAKYLPAGSYSSEATGAGSINIADENSSYLYINGDLLSISKASMNIELNDEIYDVTMEFTTEQGTFVATYTGKIEGVEFFYTLNLTEARRVKVDGEKDGEYCIKINNAPLRTVELTLDLFADASSTTLPAGTYTIGTTTNPGTVSQTGSQLTLTTPTETTEQFASGTVVVTQSGDTYTFDINLADADGYEYKGTFSGEIANMVRDDDDPSDMTVINFNRYKKYLSSSDTNAWFMLLNDDSVILDINAFTDGSSTYLPAGTYTLGDNENAWTIKSGSRSTLTQKFKGDTRSTVETITEATMTVTADGDQYTIVADITVASGKYRCKYSGSFPTEK